MLIFNGILIRLQRKSSRVLGWTYIQHRFFITSYDNLRRLMWNIQLRCFCIIHNVSIFFSLKVIEILFKMFTSEDGFLLYKFHIYIKLFSFCSKKILIADCCIYIYKLFQNNYVIQKHTLFYQSFYSIRWYEIILQVSCHAINSIYSIEDSKENEITIYYEMLEYFLSLYEDCIS